MVGMVQSENPHVAMRADITARCYLGMKGDVSAHARQHTSNVMKQNMSYLEIENESSRIAPSPCMGL